MRLSQKALRFLMDLPVGATCILAGKPGVGKSAHLQAVCETGIWSRVVIIDPEAAIDREQADAWTEGAPRHWEGPLWPAPTFLRLYRILDEPSYQYVVYPVAKASLASQRNEERARQTERVIADCMESWRSSMEHGAITVILEEAGLSSRNMSDALNEAAATPRHRRIRLIIVSQEVSRIAKDARGKVSHALCWAPGDTADSRVYRGWGGKGFERRAQAAQDEPVLWMRGQPIED